MSLNLDTLRKVAEAATPGPWHQSETGVLGAREDWDLARGPARIMAAQMPWRRERMEANAKHVATFDPPTVLALLSRLEKAEQDRDKLRNRLDAMRRQRDGYRNQLRKTEQQVAQVRDLLAYLEKLASGDKHYAELIDRDLDGDTRRLADQGLGGGQDG